MIKVRSLKKNYGVVTAVNGIDFDVTKGEVFGLIGPDGAGKTSVFHILGGVMAATEGEVEILGRNVHDARSFIGYLTQSFSLYQDLSVKENLQYVGRLRNLSDKDILSRGYRYLEMFDMHRFADRLAGRLSGGMKQKLALACALIIEPKLLLLDEPTVGVDPVSRREFWDALATLSQEGMTIVVATPYLDEAEKCTRIALMFNGQIYQTGTPAEIKNDVGLQRLEVRASDLGIAEEFLTKLPDIADVQRFGDRLDIMTPNANKGEEQTRAVLKEGGLEVYDIKQAEPTLESAFVSILRKQLGDVHIPAFPYKNATGTNKNSNGNKTLPAIQAQHLNKKFGNFHAVKDINIDIKYGEIYGLLGANGAGKTTTIKMLCGLSAPTDGNMMLAGEHGSLRSTLVRQRIGYMSQKFSLYDDLTIVENLDYFAGVYGIPLRDREVKKKWVLEFSGLVGQENMLTGDLPGGWKQRVAFGSAIMHEPNVLFLDEPTSGVDPIARRNFWKMINTLADKGTAILVTTHYLEEAEQCNRLGFMVAGELVTQGTPASVKAERHCSTLEDAFISIVEEARLQGKVANEE